MWASVFLRNTQTGVRKYAYAAPIKDRKEL